jgi:DNA-binding transcriptional MerR regulator
MVKRVQMYLISELAKQANTTVDAVRFYQKKGLIHASMQAANQYYYYDQQCLQRLVFIKNCRDLDISLAEIGQLFFLLEDPARCCQTVNTLMEQHIDTLDQKIAQLQQFRDQLLRINQSCTQIGSIKDCSIIKHLERG